MKSDAKKNIRGKKWFIYAMIFLGIGSIWAFLDERVKTTWKERFSKTEASLGMTSHPQEIFDKYFFKVDARLSNLGYIGNRVQETWTAYDYIIKKGKKSDDYLVTYGIPQGSKDTLNYSGHFYLGLSQDLKPPYNVSHTKALLQSNTILRGTIKTGLDVIANRRITIQDITNAIEGNHKKLVDRGLKITETWDDVLPVSLTDPRKFLAGKGITLQKGDYSIRLYHFISGIEFNLDRRF